MSHKKNLRRETLAIKIRNVERGGDSTATEKIKQCSNFYEWKISTRNLQCFLETNLTAENMSFHRA